MLRNDAIEALAREELEALTSEGRENLLMDSWTINVEDSLYHELTSDLQEELQRSDAPEYPATDSRYDSLLLLSLTAKFRGVKNEYLESRLLHLGVEHVKVEGVIEQLVPCPCCSYRTISARGEYEVCPVCFWEDDGSDNLDRYSSPNHMTLREGKQNFAQLGAVSEQVIKFVLKDARERYLAE